MSILSLQIGQCGNQIGSQFYETIYEDCINESSSTKKLNSDYINSSLNTFYNVTNDGKLKARCIQIDMEEKVIAQLRMKTNEMTWTYGNNFLTAKCGSGNNWAYGYFMHGARYEYQVHDLIQNELEKCDFVDGILTTMSLAGGTGSGFGTRLLVNSSDFFHKIPILTQLIWPYKKGEISVQAYNTVLTIGHLLSSNTNNNLDGFIIHQNDNLHQICCNRLLASNPNKTINIEHLNELISHQVAGVFQPVLSQSGLLENKRLSSFLYNLYGHPDYRLVRMLCLPYMPSENKTFCTETWKQLARHGRQMLLTGSCQEDKLDWSVSSTGINADKRFRSNHLPLINCMSVLRGVEVEDQLANSNQFTSDLTRNLLLSDQDGSTQENVILQGHPRCFNQYPRSLFVATNGGGVRLSPSSSQKQTDDCLSPAAQSSDIPFNLNLMSSKAWNMFAAKAYLHQYERYGFTKDLFMDCVATVKQVAHCYSTL